MIVGDFYTTFSVIRSRFKKNQQKYKFEQHSQFYLINIYR